MGWGVPLVVGSRLSSPLDQDPSGTLLAVPPTLKRTRGHKQRLCIWSTPGQLSPPSGPVEKRVWEFIVVSNQGLNSKHQGPYWDQLG